MSSEDKPEKVNWNGSVGVPMNQCVRCKSYKRQTTRMCISASVYAQLCDPCVEEWCIDPSTIKTLWAQDLLTIEAHQGTASPTLFANGMTAIRERWRELALRFVGRK